MAIDLRQSRVGYSDRCKWYKAVVTGGNALTMNPACAGVFYADEQSPETETMEQLGAVMVRKITTAIKTPDSVDDLKSNDYVSYNGETWIVTGTAKAETNSRSRRFSTNAPIDTIIQLRR
ncbi:MAG: hypothetical protein WCX48_12125 [Bacteroidales bacterium]|jgi:hypothetical protein